MQACITAFFLDIGREVGVFFLPCSEIVPRLFRSSSAIVLNCFFSALPLINFASSEDSPPALKQSNPINYGNGF